MVGFHNAVSSGALNNWVSGSSQQIAFGRGIPSYPVATSSHPLKELPVLLSSITAIQHGRGRSLRLYPREPTVTSMRDR